MAFSALNWAYLAFLAYMALHSHACTSMQIPAVLVRCQLCCLPEIPDICFFEKLQRKSLSGKENGSKKAVWIYIELEQQQK